jgi:hypothetical protein
MYCYGREGAIFEKWQPSSSATSSTTPQLSAQLFFKKLELELAYCAFRISAQSADEKW